MNASNNGMNSTNQPALVISDINVAQINLHHCKKATANFCWDIVNMHNTDISLVQEPWTRGNTIHGFGQLKKRLFYNRAGKRLRAAIHVSPNIDAMLLNQFTDDDLVAVRICRNPTEGGDFVIVALRLSDPTTRTFSEKS